VLKDSAIGKGGSERLLKTETRGGRTRTSREGKQKTREEKKGWMAKVTLAIY